MTREGLTQTLLQLRESWNEAHREQNPSACKKFWSLALDCFVEKTQSADPALLERIPGFLVERLSHEGREWERLLTQAALYEGFLILVIESETAVSEITEYFSKLQSAFKAEQGGFLWGENAAPALSSEGIWSGRFFGFAPKDSKENFEKLGRISVCGSSTS